jgi:tetratricopeptide (TPR) repeat protein
MALFGLARITANTPGNAVESMEHTAQAIAYYQAALLAEPRNYLAANELGVLEVANGNLTRARELFVHSVNLVPRAGTWQNLVVVHTRLGEQQLAEQAKQRMAASPQPPVDQRLPVEWLDPSVFATTSPMAEGLAVAPTTKKATPTQAPANAQPASAAEQSAPAAKKSLAEKLPWLSRH